MYYYSSCTCFIFFCRVIPCLQVLSTLQSSNITSNFCNAAMFINTDFRICVSVSMIFKSNLAVLNSSTVEQLNYSAPTCFIVLQFLLGKKKNFCWKSRLSLPWRWRKQIHPSLANFHHNTRLHIPVTLYNCRQHKTKYYNTKMLSLPFKKVSQLWFIFFLLQTDTLITLKFLTEKC
jgi:hypothetical protein